MSGVHNVPVELQIARSKKGLSKKQIEKATTVPIKLGNGNIAMPKEVAQNPIAKEKWAELAKIYDGTDYITSADSGLISQLCFLYSDIADLRAMLNSPDVDTPLRLNIHAKIDSKLRMATVIGEKLFLNPLVRKRGLPPAPKEEPKGELAEAGFNI